MAWIDDRILYLQRCRAGALDAYRDKSFPSAPRRPFPSAHSGILKTSRYVNQEGNE